MAITKFKVDREMCIGASSCVVAAPSVYELDQENKAIIKQKNNVKNSGPTDVKNLEDANIDEKTLMEAAESCPVKAIFVYNESGKQIYP
jgi:ferredoxin